MSDDASHPDPTPGLCAHLWERHSCFRASPHNGGHICTCGAVHSADPTVTPDLALVLGRALEPFTEPFTDDGRAATRSIAAALTDAGLEVEDAGYVSALEAAVCWLASYGPGMPPPEIVDTIGAVVEKLSDAE